jgi:anthranilate synthase component 1
MKIPKLELAQKPKYKDLGDGIDLYELFCAVEQTYETCFLFESLGEPGYAARYCVFGFAPQHQVSAREGRLLLDDQSFEVENPYYALRELMPAPTFSRHYAGGLVGYLGYDAVNYFEPGLKVQTHPDFEAFAFDVYTDGVVLDTMTGELTYFYYTEDRSALLVKLVGRKPRKPAFSATFLGDGLTPEQHGLAVEVVREEVMRGNIFQCEVGYKSTYRLTGNSLGIYGKLRQLNPSPFMYFVKSAGKTILGASPELLFSLADGQMETRPLAGSIRRGKTAREDLLLARTLLNDPKEVAEHRMLVDLHRNDIGRVARFGSVQVKELMQIKKFSHVQHIESIVRGTLRSGEDMFSALAANFPAGTLTGAPKIEAMKIIDAHEPAPRGPYGGGVGHFGFNGDCDFAIAIRSLFVAGDLAYAQTSGGIVYDSDPNKEYDEIQRKLAPMREVLAS